MIESNDMLFELRSDSLTNLAAVALWLQGSNNLNGDFVPSPEFNGLLSFQTPRIMFMQIGLPRAMAENAGFEFAGRINPDSTMAMGFADQQTNAAGPAEIVTFVGNSSAKLSNADARRLLRQRLHRPLLPRHRRPVPVLRHAQPGPPPRRGRAVHRALPVHVPVQPARHAERDTRGRATPTSSPTAAAPPTSTTCSRAPARPRPRRRTAAGTFTPANATMNATFTGEGRIGHIDGLQRSSRAADGTPLHIRNDGPGLDGMDVPAFRTFPGANGADMPAGSNQFKLQFFAFVPTGDFFNQMRANQACQDLQKKFFPDNGDDNGLERFITATRRQNFLVPPRRHRSFPLVELADPPAKRAAARRAAPAKAAKPAAPAPAASPSSSGGSGGGSGGHGGGGGGNGGGGGHGGGGGGGHGGGR